MLAFESGGPSGRSGRGPPAGGGGGRRGSGAERGWGGAQIILTNMHEIQTTFSGGGNFSDGA